MATTDIAIAIVTLPLAVWAWYQQYQLYKVLHEPVHD